MAFSFPLIYPILDSSFIPAVGRGEFLRRLGGALADTGVTLLEYRNKPGNEAELLSDAKVLRQALPAGQVKLILDDRADLVEPTGFDGVHVDAGDVPAREARRLLGPERIIGTFGGSEALVPGILDEPADYLSIGPVFTTTTKQTSKAVIGVDGVHKLRGQAGPDVVLVAAAGITLETVAAVLEAGATTVAVAAALFSKPDPAAEFKRWLTAIPGLAQPFQLLPDSLMVASTWVQWLRDTATQELRSRRSAPLRNVVALGASKNCSDKYRKNPEDISAKIRYNFNR